MYQKAKAILGMFQSKAARVQCGQVMRGERSHGNLPGGPQPNTENGKEGDFKKPNQHVGSRSLCCTCCSIYLRLVPDISACEYHSVHKPGITFSQTS
ncbi:hypothetical protein T10_12409 [Trichinella papuae]|uniref:Uncharacterized protein n=1 Tax=Trichinella papuae TaxID=268474 RepID=A0A0V1M9L0_9BILA|nr:hypothetical protein T10_12409 [Trichinella papuae]